MIIKKIILKNKDEILNILGPQDIYLRNIEKEFNVDIYVNNDPIADIYTLSVKGKNSSVDKAINKIKNQMKAYHKIKEDEELENFAQIETPLPEGVIYKTEYGQYIRPRTPNQIKYAQAIKNCDITFAIGPAGTGKTYLATAMALSALKNKEIKRVIITRPIVEAGEKLGFLPGDISEKVHPYLKPLYDSFYSLLGPEKFHMYREEEIIETVPLAYMRGRTLENAFIILDEAQNTTREQMKMFLTRMGVFSKMVITGDITQIDIKEKETSGLVAAIKILKKINDIAIVYLDKEDVVRHPIVAKIINAYEVWEKDSDKNKLK